MRNAHIQSWAVLLLTGSGMLLSTGCGKEAPYQASAQAAVMDQRIDWSYGRLIAVQDQGRYKTLESFARENFATMTGDETLPGLSPLASLCEWLFNRDAYVDVPVIRVSSRGVRSRLVTELDEASRQRIKATKRFTLRELFKPEVEQLLSQMETEPMKRNAVGRVRQAQAVATRLAEFVTIVPQPGGDRVAPWAVPQRALSSLTDEQLAQMGLSRDALPEAAQPPIRGLAPEDAMTIAVAWSSLRSAWMAGRADDAEAYLARLAGVLPTLADEGVYPRPSQLRAEAKYYAFGKFTGGWVLYFLAFLVSILSLVTRWKWPWALTLLLLVAGLAVHAYGLALRWYILDRIPVANMFEAVVASAWMGIAAAVVIELFFKKRVFLVAASVTGFMALLMGGYMLPGAELGTIPKILDDIQLRIHTVLIIASYALIFLAAVIAFIYLIGYYGLLIGGSRSPAVAATGAHGSAAVVDDPQVLAQTVSDARPVVAGATPGDENPTTALPQWLNDIDWSHLIIINMVFVLLFLGTITGAWWADYSWGRPWGWDPKEVFALNTWIIYAILIHVRYVVKQRGLWTAWLSIAGCAMMAFNWFFVNFFIASIHSYV